MNRRKLQVRKNTFSKRKREKMKRKKFGEKEG